MADTSTDTPTVEIELYAPWRERTNLDKFWEPEQYTEHPAFTDGKPTVVNVDQSTADRMKKSGGAGDVGAWEAAREQAAAQAAASAGVDLTGALSEKDAEIADLRAQLDAAKAEAEKATADAAAKAASGGKGSTGASSS